MDSSEDDKDVRAREGCRWCWPTGLFAFALLVVPPPVEAQQPYRFWLAAQYNWEAKTGFYLNFENTTEGGQPCRLDRLSLILGVGDGGQWRFLSTPSRWQFDREYSVRGVIAPDRLELWLDEEKVAASEGRLKGWEGPITACHIPGWANAPAEYIIRQRSLGVAGSGERRIGLNLEDEASRPLALLLFEPQAPRLIPWMVEPGEALTLEARFRIVRHPDLHTLAPFIDRYGQCRYADWPGKVTSDQELRFADEEEDRRLAGWGEPSEYDRYGGYRWAGWEEEATGFYRLARRQGYWWLVTPEGNPCFYVGLCSAPALRWEQTPVTEREFLFEWLPPQEGPYAACWDRNQWGVRDGTRYLAMHTANLIRKYGEDWIQQALQRTLRRLRAWGFSGVGKWGAPPATPCLPVLSYWGVPKLVRHPDVFDPQVQGRFREELRAQIEPRRDDPWVVGWSLGNEFDEIVTQDEIREVLRKPAETPAKRALVDFARERL